MTLEEVKNRLTQAYPDADINVEDPTGGGNHFHLSIIWPSFEDMSRVERHQHVMSQFDSELKSGEVHALAIKATPA